MTLQDIVSYLLIGSVAIIAAAVVLGGLAYAFGAWLSDGYTDPGDD